MSLVRAFNRVGACRRPSASGAALGPDQTPAIASVNAFIDALAELSRAAWLDIGRALTDGRTHSAGWAAACASLTTAIHDRELDVAAWFVRDSVETCACLAASAARSCSTHDRRALAAARAAADGCALALLARDSLSLENVRSLCAPFARVIEVTTTPLFL